ncbi:hypothetical protein B5X24_HaOG215849 [Helicoverpa armigera]|nr:hypothetical protein B5X24_HaOG215849 [Helicoverpa armigera]
MTSGGAITENLLKTRQNASVRGARKYTMRPYTPFLDLTFFVTRKIVDRWLKVHERLLKGLHQNIVKSGPVKL